MIIRKKVQSFTISEMLVVMILTIIVISIAMIVLNLVQKQFGEIQQNFKNNTAIRTLEQALWQDLNRNEAFFDSKNDQLICVSPTDTVFYKFKENYLLRNDDTLRITIQEKKFFLDASTSISTVDAIELKLSKEFQYKQLFIYKIKAASYYMNQHGI